MADTSSQLHVRWLGRVPYVEALAVQDAMFRNGTGNRLLLMEHPHVFTYGPSADLKKNLRCDPAAVGADFVRVKRGGDITYHGPGQLVGYPIVRLAKPTELVGFVRELESALIQVCAEFGITTQRIAGRSGVWVVDQRGERKIAAIGIRVAQGVTMHGFALNVNPDLAAFNRIIPCGISDASVTSLERETGRTLTCSEIANIVKTHMIDALKRVSK